MAVVGLGRTGASLALAVQALSLDLTVVGHDRSPEVMRRARQRGAVDETAETPSEAAARADLLVVAVPAGEVEAVLRAVGEDVQEHALVLALSGLTAQSHAWASQYLRRGHFIAVAPVFRAGLLAEVELRERSEASGHRSGRA